MPIHCFSVKVATAGTPQQLAEQTGSQVIMGGVTYPVASATLRGFQIQVQPLPTNTAAKIIYVGSKNMVVSTKVGCGFALLTGDKPVSLGQFGGMEDIGDLWIDTDAGTNNTDGVMVTVVA